jgi:hypothetical protein
MVLSITPMGQVVTSRGTYLGTKTNNVSNYIIVIKLLRDAISHGFLSL